MTSSSDAILSRTVFIIPVYNHAGSIGAIIEKLHAFQRPVYVIDDGSTDNTAKILDQLNGVNNIRHPSNQGKGRALMTGFAAASLVADWAITLDADGQHDPADALNLLKAVKDCERSIVIGKRTHMLQKGAPWTSRWGRRFSNFWVWTCSGLKLSDTQSGFRLYPLPEALMMNARGKRFQFEVEILVLAAWTGIPVREAEVSTQYRFIGHRVSHFRPVMDFWRNTLTFSRLLVLRLFTSKRFRATGMK